MTDRNLSERRARIESIAEHLTATAELPVDPTASPYLGEASAVAADAVAAIREGNDTVVARRVQQVHDLLSHVDETGHSEADDHVAAALDLALQELDRTDERDT